MEDDYVLSGIFIFFILSILFVVFTTKIQDWGDYIIPRGVVIVSIIGFALVLNEAVVWRSRNYMPQLNTAGVHGSINLDHSPKLIYDPTLSTEDLPFHWAVYGLGAHDLYPNVGKLSICVVPYFQVNKADKSHLALTHTSLVPFDSLPHPVKVYLHREKNIYNINKIYFGWVSEDFYHKNPEFSDLQSKFEALWGQINFQGDLLEWRNDKITDMVELARNIAGEKAHWYDMFKRSPEVQQPPPQ